ncbi:putative expansin-B2 [Arachis duranensis]|uniref:Expansin-B2 n=1 Tax=Arachis duranensis TaxID=130453 RepID=A0A6P4CFZ5_ARADU|nr:putative expansin-B2 [Arachis duranensis]
MKVHTFNVVVLYCMLLICTCYCFNPKLSFYNSSKVDANAEQWQPASATWYGPPDGAGTDGGACGYGSSVGNPPLSKLVSAGGPNIFNNGEGCGACYEVKCTENEACSGETVTVMISDQCPGCPATHFDLSGFAFGSLAKPGQQDNLRNAGRINLQYQRVSCSFGQPIVFTIDNGANQYYFATEIEYENGEGNLVDVELKQANQDSWIPMKRLWGARWVLNLGSLMQPPFSLKLTETSVNGSSKTIEANNVIPAGWQPGQVIRSAINFTN